MSYFLHYLGAAPSSENFTGVVDVRLSFGSTSQTEQNCLDGNLVPLDVETSPDSFDLAQFSIPLRASKRLRRHSTELYRAGNNSQCSVSLSSLNETSEGKLSALNFLYHVVDYISTLA